MESLAVPSGDFVTPWRVVLVGDTPGDLLESTVTVNLAAPLSLADASWVTPGKGLFNWRTLGYVADDDFTYEQNTASVKRLIDFAADNGIEYVQVTDGWFGEIDNGQLISQAEGFSVEETMVHAGAKGVGIILYAARTGGRQVTNTTDEELFQLLHDLGAVGVKHDYGGNNAPFTRAALKSTAQKQMLLNIHANPAALTGGRRTIPNAITRQTGWGQQDGRKAFEPTDFLEMAMVNALLGPFDQINGIYDLNEMPNRLKGSRNPINSTVAGENARVLIVFSGLIKLPDVPEEYDKKADMFEFLREIPSTWDDTRVLHSSLPNYITTARRSASEWFVCSATNESARTLSIPLDFLDANVSYDVTYYEDDHDGSSPTHYINNRETYQVRTGVVTNSHTVSAIMVAGGGHCMWIRPAGTLALSVAPLTGDDTINGTEQASGFEIGGDTGSQEGVEVIVILGGRKLATVTSAGAPTASWAAAVPADAAYLAESEVGVSVSARLGTASSNPVARSIAVDLTPPSAVSWTAPARLTVGEAIGPMSPLGSIDTDAAFDSSSLPAGLTIDRLTGVISGTPSVADPAGRTATVAIVDDAGNATTVEVAFPRVEADEQTNSAPEITTMGPFSVNEGAIFVATLTASDDETVQADLIWSIPAGTDGGADASSFTLSQAGVLSFTAAKDYETPDDADTDRTYEVTVEVSDGTDSDMAELLVTLLNVTELTAITGPESVTFPENSWSRVATFTASSEENRAGIEWILGGTDSDHFSIDSPPGALRFALQAVAPRIFPEPPDFEAPVDPDAANTYELTLLAKAGSSVTDTRTLTVTVTDVDEEGALSLSSTRPALGAALRAVLSDPDGVTAGTEVWQWERSTGRNSWAVIDGAAAESYTPVAADTNTFLRVTATYEDEHGTGKTVSEVAPNVVTGLLLTGLTAETDDSRAETARGLYPAFDPQTLHYGIGCNSTDTLVLTVSAPANARVAVAGVQAASAPMAVDVSEDSDVAIRLSDASGAGTTYVVHCLPEVFFDIETHTFPNTDAFEDLILFNLAGFTLMDRNGVPRLRRGIAGAGPFAMRFHRVGADGAYRYGFRAGAEYTILDEDFEVVADDVRTVSPLTRVNHHDFQILEDGNYLLMSYEPATPDFRDIDLPYLDGADVSSVDVQDAAFQIVTPGGDEVFTWYSWNHMAIEDCVQHRFPLTLSTDPDMRSPDSDYAHINGMHVVDGVLVASIRGCSKVLGIDVSPGVTRGDVLWRMGRTNLSDAQWAARDIGPRPLDFINDPEGEFCGQHTARFLPNGNIFLFDNGVVCAIDPWTFEELGREGYDFSRAVEYALDLEN